MILSKKEHQEREQEQQEQDANADHQNDSVSPERRPKSMTKLARL